MAGPTSSAISSGVARRWVPVAQSKVMSAAGTPHSSRARSKGGSTVRLGIGRVRSGKTTATLAEGRASAARDGPESGDASARRTSPCWSSSPCNSVGRITVASTGTSTVRPSKPYARSTRIGLEDGGAVGPRELSRGGQHGVGDLVDLGTHAPVQLDRRCVGRDHRFDRVELVERQLQAEGAAGQEGGTGGGRLAGSVAYGGDAQDGGEDVDPQGEPGAGTAQGHALGGATAEAAGGDHLHAAQHVPGHRLDHGTGEIVHAVRRAQAHEAGPGVVAPPGGAGAV